MTHRGGLRELRLKRRMLVALAELQRAQLRHDLQHGPWMPALRGARTAWRWVALLRAVLRKPAAGTAAPARGGPPAER